MNKRAKIISILGIAISVFICVAIVMFCMSYFTQNRLDNHYRPDKVPKEAVWIGGSDGGCYILLQSEFADTCRFIIYYDYTGDVWHEGLFYCDKNNFDIISNSDWRDLLICYDGVKIIMTAPDNMYQYIEWNPIKYNVPQFLENLQE